MIKAKIKKALLKDIPCDSKRKALAEHGIDILISDGRNLLCVFFLSILIHNTDQAVLYILVLSTLRVHTGGWHASSELNCFITYQGMFLLFSLLNIFIIPKGTSIAIMAFSIIYIVLFSPVEHKFNPLSSVEIKSNRLYCFIYSAGYFALFLSLIKYSYIHAQTIAFTFLFNVVLMELLRSSENYKYHGY